MISLCVFVYVSVSLSISLSLSSLSLSLSLSFSLCPPLFPSISVRWLRQLQLKAISDDACEFTEHGDSFDFPVGGAVAAGECPDCTGTVKEIATGKTFDVKLRFAEQYLNPGLVQRMSGRELS